MNILHRLWRQEKYCITFLSATPTPARKAGNKTVKQVYIYVSGDTCLCCLCGWTKDFQKTLFLLYGD